MESLSDEERIKRALFDNTIASLSYEESCRIVASTVSKAVEERFAQLSGEEKEEILAKLDEPNDN